jgi:hypothetical protein
MTTPLAAAIFSCVIVAPLALGWWFARRRRPRWAVRAAVALYPFVCVAAIGLAAGAGWRTYAVWGLALGFLELSIVLQWRRQAVE